MTDLSIIIPARNEMFLARTIQDLLANIRGDTDIIAILDGQWADPPVEQNPRVTVVHHNQSIGQRAACNEAARISTARYVMKVDAHCAFDEGFDVKLMADMQDDWTVAPLMRNLHVFDWVCKNDHRRYQGPSGVCKICGEETTRDIVWYPKPSPRSRSYCFDSEPHFQYFAEYNKRPEGTGDLTESMSLQGSAFMLTRDRYFELNVCDETWGSWGSQGLEVAIKTWLSGGRVMINSKTWYAHCFRTQGGDFGFPYSLSGRQVEHAKKTAREIFYTNKWDKQVRPLAWLVKRFWPVPGWKDEDLLMLESAAQNFVPATSGPRPRNSATISAGVLYYTDNQLDAEIMEKCQKQLSKSVGSTKLVSVSLQSINLGKNIVLPLQRGHLTLFKQILAGLEELDTDVVFFAEHDVLYNQAHFTFRPPKSDVFYYNTNVWKVRMSDGHGLYVDDLQQTSGLCAYRELLIGYYKQVIKTVEEDGFSVKRISFEPGTREGNARSWKSEKPIIDLRHDRNLTPSRWTPDEFRNKRYTKGWREQDNIPGWGSLGHFWKKI